MTNTLDKFATYDYQKMHSHAGIRSDLFQRPLQKTLVTDFFGGVQNVEITQTAYKLSHRKPAESNVASRLLGRTLTTKKSRGSSISIPSHHEHVVYRDNLLPLIEHDVFFKCFLSVDIAFVVGLISSFMS